MKVTKKHDLQQIEFNHSSDMEYDHSLTRYKE